MRKAIAAALLTIGVVGAWMGLNVWQAWNALEQIPFDTSTARASLPFAEQSPVADDATTVLIVGVDRRPEQPYTRADAIHLLTLDKATPELISFPRDLLVIDPCTGAESTLSRQYEPCEVSAPERVAVSVEDLAGIAVDAYVEFEFNGYTALIDELGGFEVCVEHAMRPGRNRPVMLEAGCQVVGGEAALFWARHRQALELVDGEWRPVEESGDLVRVERIQAVLMSVLEDLKRVRPWSPGADDITGHVSVSAMSLGDGLRLARRLSAVKPQELAVSAHIGAPTVTASGMYALDPG